MTTHLRSTLLTLAATIAAPCLGAEAEGGKKSESVQSLVKQLSSESFAERKVATRKLVELGAKAVPAVAKAADSDDLELPSRCVNILKAMFHSEDEKTKAAAKTALEKLTKSDRAYLAKRAELALEEPKPEPPPEDDPLNRFGRIRNRIQAGAFGNAGKNMRVTQKSTNGERETDVEVDGKKIHITDSNGQDIAVTVTETVDGKETKKEYAGKNLADLKKKHPEAAKLYEEYAEGNGAGGIRVFAGPGAFPGGFPNFPNLPAPFQPFPKPDAKNNLNQAVKRIDESIERLRKLAKDGLLPQAQLDTLVKQLEATKKQLQSIDP